MSALAIHRNPNINFGVALDPKPTPKREMRELPHHYFGPLNIPGIFNLYHIPSEFIATVRDQFEAGRLGDTEGSYDNWLKIFEAPLNLISSLFSNVELAVKLLSGCGVDLSHLPSLLKVAKVTPILGLIVCAFESGIEIRGLTHATSIFKMLDTSFETLTDNPEEMDRVILENLNRLNQAYCDDTSAVERIKNLKFSYLDRVQKEERIRQYTYLTCGAKDRSLIRRVHSRCAQKVHALVPQLLQEYTRIQPEDTAGWRARSCALLTDVKKQSYKKIVMHVLGLLAVAITIAGLIATLCGCPFAVPFTLLLIGGILSTGRVIISDGMMHTRGYTLDPYNLIPNWIKNLYHKIFHRSLPVYS